MQFWNVVICLNSNHQVWIPLDVFRGKDKDKEKQTKKEPATEHFAGFKKEKTEAEAGIKVEAVTKEEKWKEQLSQEEEI